MHHGCKRGAPAILAFEEPMKKAHMNFKVVKFGLFSNEEHSWMHSGFFLCLCDCCIEGCREIKWPLCLENRDFDRYVLRPGSSLEMNSSGELIPVSTHEYYYQVQQ